MCKSPLHPFLVTLPKCEHHIHLEGSLEPAFLFQLAKKNNIVLPSDDPSFANEERLKERYQHFTSLDDFLHYYYIGIKALLTVTDYAELAWRYFLEAHSQGVLHAEVFFDPQAHLGRVKYTTIIEGFERARQRAREELGLTSELICCFLRHLPEKQSIELFESQDLQRSFTDGTVIGIGLDSSEKDFPPSDFLGLYSRAREQGLRRTAHAGEEGPVDYIATALRSLRCERIDHGIKLVDDGSILSYVAEKEIMLTVCPLSNVRLRCVDSVARVPIRVFLENGVKFSINSDDPAYFGGYILENYCAVQEAHDLSVKEWEGIARASIDGSWCSEERKNQLRGALWTFLEEWRKKMGTLGK
jgi:adenosine deaminase